MFKPTHENTDFFEVIDKPTPKQIKVKFADGGTKTMVLDGNLSIYQPCGIARVDIPIIELGHVYRAQVLIKKTHYVLNLQHGGLDYSLKPVTPEPQLKVLDWNQLSELGLLERINREICHPLGLAVCRTPEHGISDGALVSPDGSWDYGEDVPTLVKSDDEIKKLIELMSYVETVEK